MHTDNILQLDKMNYEFDYANWPIVVLNIEGNAENEKLESLFEDWIKMYTTAKSKLESFRLIINAKEIGDISPSQVFKIGSFLRYNKPNTKLYINRTAILVKEKTTLIKLILAVYTPSNPLEVFDNYETLIEWIS